MRPRHIAYIIWIVIALLGTVCLIVPNGGFSIGKWTLRWPTLAEALDMDRDSGKNFDFGILNDSLLAEIDTIVLSTDSIVEQDTLVTKDSVQQKSQPIIPEVNIANTDSRAYLMTFYAALDSTSDKPIRVVHYVN